MPYSPTYSPAWFDELQLFNRKNKAITLHSSLLDKSKTCVYRGKASLANDCTSWQLLDLQISMGFREMHSMSIIGPYSHKQPRHVFWICRYAGSSGSTRIPKNYSSCGLSHTSLDDDLPRATIRSGQLCDRDLAALPSSAPSVQHFAARACCFANPRS